MNVLILGGTGAMGTHLVQLLSSNGHDVFVTSRSKRESTDKIHYIQGNAHDSEFLNTILQKKWDAIVDFMVYNTKAFRERVEQLLNATSQYIFISSARVYANTESPITEDSPRLLDIINDSKYLETDEYALTKARQEDILKETGLQNWTIIRPYITYSEDRLQLGVLEKEEWLYRALKGRTIVFSTEITSKLTTLTYGFDVANGIAAILLKDNALKRVFHITANENHKWEDILKLYLSILENHLGFKPNYKLLDTYSFLEIRPVIHQVKYDRLFNRQFDNNNINQFIKIEDFTPTISGLKYCITEFLTNIKFKNINWKSEALKDKICKEHTPLKEITGLKQKIKYLIYRYSPFIQY